MSVDFLSMPDDDLPEFSVAERQIQEHQESLNQETGSEADREAAEQAALEAQANVADDVDDEDEPGEQIAGEQTTVEAAQEEDKGEQEQEEEESPLAQADDKVKAPAAKEKPKAAPEAEETAEQKAEREAAEAAAADDKKAGEGKDKQEAPAVTPEDFQAKILAPFKANGRELQVRNADEAIRLMQMGANYNAKMQALKPNLTMMKQLDEAGLLKPEVVANVIDLLKEKNPAAIAKLAKDAGVDPLEVSEDDVKGYAPKVKEADPRAEALDAELDMIQHSPSYPKLMGHLKNWDVETKDVIVNNPQVLGYFNSHMSNGVYDIIESEINRRKALGTINGSLSFIAAYKAVGDELQSKGAFNHIGQDDKSAASEKSETPAAPAKRVSATAAPAKDKDAAARRRAAAPTTSSQAAPVKAPGIDPLAMSDDDFEKMSAQFMR